ncbi:hypothetical protein [Deinococcus ficus]|uniref:hypothetical protein n=1 Tax=Deinococcus ficus TaxID=317577 RepID=UPI0017495F4E|nr:hypothetical protein [Deinococcus ficus]GHF75608.1 hypothetical protein GCM10017782_11640 [Deinococcus ficus]
MTPDGPRKLQDQLRDGIIRDNARDFLDVENPRVRDQLDDKSTQRRQALTGKERNDAEAKRYDGILRTVLTHNRHGRTAEAQKLTGQMLARLEEIAPHLEEKGGQLYAIVSFTPDGRPRTVRDALETAANNTRRAIGAGQTDLARQYIGNVNEMLGWSLDDYV